MPPGMGGPETAEKIREYEEKENGKVESTMIVGVTGYTSD